MQHESIELLSQYLQIDTTNPPGNERECIAYLDGVLQSYGIETTLLAKDPQRPSYFVASYLKYEGYKIIPVNPTADEILGERWPIELTLASRE